MTDWQKEILRLLDEIENIKVDILAILIENDPAMLTTNFGILYRHYNNE